MKCNILLVSLTILATTSCVPSSSSQIKIIGGQVVSTDDPLFRRVGGLYDQNGKLQCTVSALKSDLFLTAAHCVANRTTDHWTIQFSKNQKNSETLDVRSVKPHPDFSFANIFTLEPDSAPNDIAIVNTAKPSQIAIPTGIYSQNLKSENESQFNWTIVGLGRTNGSDPNSKGLLQKANVSVAKFNDKVHEATSENSAGIMACFGDSGGPAFYIKDTTIQIVGVISRGDSGCLKGLTVITDATAFKEFLNSK